MKKATVATQHAANSAETSAGIARDATVSAINQSQLDQRAWVGIIGTSPPKFKEGERFLYAVPGRWINLAVVVTNSGKSPAKILQSDIAINHYPVSGKFTPQFKGRSMHSIAVIQPSMQNTMNSLPVSFNDTTWKGVLADTERLYFYGRIRYEDIFRHQHTTTFCMFLQPTLDSFAGCDTYSDAD